MRILTVDIGTGTQDIFLYDSRLDLENGFKMIAPSPTMIVQRRLREATRRRQPVLLSGVTMGGGPSQWAAEAHLRAGLALYATPAAARSFNDDLDQVSAMGVRVIGEEEAASLPDEVLRLELRDFDFAAIRASFEIYGVSLERLDAVAVAVFDHGNAPPDVSDRLFRFDYLDRRIRAPRRPGAQHALSAFAFRAEEIPPIMTRMAGVAASATEIHAPLVVMDTAPAAILGATFDPQASSRRRGIIANIGNFHTLAFRLGNGRIEGVFEHHTGLLNRGKLESLLRALADGSLQHTDVFDDHGHGALIYEPQPLPLGRSSFDVVVTGPRRNLLAPIGQPGSLRPYFAVPFGDMMLAGCFGLLAATADLLPELTGPLRDSLNGKGRGASPWEIEDIEF